MAEGKIKRWFPDKGYGFITPDDGSQDVKFFADNLQEVDSLQIAEGLRVRYELRRRADRPTTYQFWLLDLPAKPKIVHRQGTYHFLNPYNFVRYIDQPRQKDHILGDCPPPPHDRYVGLTGRITCKVETVTPLFISDSHAVEGKVGDHRSYRFFQVDGQLALPASSLRGMFRLVFEAVTNSCFVAFGEDPLSLHFPSARSPWLVPARVERDGENWQLRLLPGTTNLQIESESSHKKNPEGTQYAAWCATYRPLKPSKTLRGIGPKGRSLSQKQLRERESFIERTQDSNRNPEGVAHGEECYTLLRCFQHPHPRIKFWDVVEIRREQSSLPRPGNNERIEHGWLCVTNQNIEPKHSERFFFRGQDNRSCPELIDLPENVRQAYESLIKDYQDRHHEAVQKRQRKNQPPGQLVDNEAGFSRFVYQHDERKLKGGELVYAMLDGTVNTPRVRFIAPVSVPRVGYERSVGELLPDFLHRCKDHNALCPACRMFGWVYHAERGEEIPQDKVTAYAGRMRLSHGTLTHSEGLLPDTTLAVLSTPKPTTTPFYLLNSEGQPDPTVNYDTDGARLRGRKFYRHQGEANPGEYQRDEKSDQNRTVQGVLKPGATFTFTLDFENLAPLELGALLYALELEDRMFHRLGYAKSLGFGSVKVTVESVQTIDWQARLQSVEPAAGWQTIEGEHYKQEFLKTMQTLYGDEFGEVLADLRAILGTPGLPVHYPRPKRQFDLDPPQFEWFVGNKRRMEKHEKGVLPPPEALALARDDAGLSLIDKDGKENRG